MVCRLITYNGCVICKLQSGPWRWSHQCMRKRAEERGHIPGEQKCWLSESKMWLSTFSPAVSFGQKVGDLLTNAGGYREHNFWNDGLKEIISRQLSISTNLNKNCCGKLFCHITHSPGIWLETPETLINRHTDGPVLQSHHTHTLTHFMLQ